ncbi:MAG TPA: DUF1631 domain-containing protein [Casimicrobiaceae bacterium]|nr:DUF1631 domain-containing protein [Casimicrobiaceae bacterium]
MNATPPTTVPAKPAPRPPPAGESRKILGDCRDLVIRRLQDAFSDILSRVSDALMDRAGRTDVREEQQLFLDARAVLQAQRAALLADFEHRMKERVNDGLSGRVVAKQQFSAIASDQLTLVETTTMDESVIRGNLKRVVENVCYDELQQLNRGVGFLLDRPDLETDGNPLAPGTIVDAFADALKDVKTDTRIKFQVLKELNQTSLAEINAIYADLNRHLVELKIAPGAMRRINAGGPADRAKPEAKREKPALPSPEVDVMAMFQRMFAGAPPPMPSGAGPASVPLAGAPPQMPSGSGPASVPYAGAPPQMPSGSGPASVPHAGAPPPSFAPSSGNDLDFPAIQMPGAPVQASATRTFAPMPTTMSGYVPSAPIISTVDLHEGLTRLQAGQSGFEIGGAMVPFSGIPEGLHNVLRDLKESQLGAKANQLESMTIEMVAMLFDFIFDTRDLPDGIKALLARLQIPVLKAAMLDGAFFAKKTHPARLLVNELAQAGLGWSPVIGQDDPLYKVIDRIVHAVLERFADDLSLFEELRTELQAFLAEEEKAAETNIASTAEEINQRDRRDIASVVVRSEVERRVESNPIPTFLATFLRTQWSGALSHVYLERGEDSEAWTSAITTLEDLVWSVQPKRSTEDRKHLIALLPSLLKRLDAGMSPQGWVPEDRERFMSNLVEAHAAAVKPALANVESPTAAVAEQAKVQVEMAKAVGDEATASRAAALAEAMAPAPPAPVEPQREILDDEYLEIARHLERGMWVEFESDDGQLAFAKLAWVSPLRGTYLFTNRQGQKALSINAEELADHFRTDRARLVEAEPLIDRAFSSMMAQMEQRFPEAVEQ